MSQNSTPPEPIGGPDWEAFGRYISGESTDAEAASVGRRLEESPTDAAFVAALERTRHAGIPRDLDVEGALARLRGRLDEPEVRPLRPREYAWRAGGGRWGLAAAAAVVLLVGGALMRRGQPEPAAVVATRSLSTGVGERDSLRLDDGTLVVLGPVSSLEVLSGYGERTREVALTGEGYFEVHHDESRPFVVRTADASIRDLGTRFVVRAGTGTSPVTRVAVTEGAVSLSSLRPRADTGILLNAGDVGTLLPDGRTFAQRGAASDAEAAWTRGTLVFRDAAMTDVAESLRRWYGIEVVMDSALAGRHLTATFSNEPVNRVLDIIALTLGARVDQQGDTAVVRPAAGTTRR